MSRTLVSSFFLVFFLFLVRLQQVIMSQNVVHTQTVSFFEYYLTSST